MKAAVQVTEMFNTRYISVPSLRYAEKMPFQVPNSVTSCIEDMIIVSGSQIAHSNLECCTEADTSTDVVPGAMLLASGHGSFLYTAPYAKYRSKRRTNCTTKKLNHGLLKLFHWPMRCQEVIIFFSLY